MSIRAADAAVLEVVTTPRADLAVHSRKWKPLIRFCSLIGLVCLFLVHGICVVYGISGGQPGSIERHVSFVLLAFYMTTLPSCAYFGWREYSNLKTSSKSSGRL